MLLSTVPWLQMPETRKITTRWHWQYKQLPKSEIENRSLNHIWVDIKLNLTNMKCYIGTESAVQENLQYWCHIFLYLFMAIYTQFTRSTLRPVCSLSKLIYKSLNALIWGIHNTYKALHYTRHGFFISTLPLVITCAKNVKTLDVWNSKLDFVASIWKLFPNWI